MLDLVTAGVEQFPDAGLEEHRGAAFVVCTGERRLVFPRGVQPVMGTTWRAWESVGGPSRLPWTLHEVVDDLLKLSGLDEEEAAGRVLAHVQTRLVPDLCAHGLPRFHPNLPPFDRDDRGPSPAGDFLPCASDTLPGVAERVVRVDHVQAMAETLYAIRLSVEWIRDKRRPLPKGLLDGLLSWPILFDRERNVTADHRDGHAPGVRSDRVLVTEVLRACLRAAPMLGDVGWEAHQTPRLTLRAQTSVALYVHDVLRHVDAIADEDRTYVCDVCGTDFVPAREPRAGEGHYCRRPECQRERQRRNQARRRAELKKEAGS